MQQLNLEVSSFLSDTFQSFLLPNVILLTNITSERVMKYLEKSATQRRPTMTSKTSREQLWLLVGGPRILIERVCHNKSFICVSKKIIC